MNAIQRCADQIPYKTTFLTLAALFFSREYTVLPFMHGMLETAVKAGTSGAISGLKSGLPTLVTNAFEKLGSQTKDLDLGDIAGTHLRNNLKTFFTASGLNSTEIAVTRIVGRVAKGVAISTLPLIALAVTVITGVPLAIAYVYYKAKHNIGRPKLATEVHQHTIFTPLAQATQRAYSSVFGGKKMEKPIYNEEITRRIDDLTNSVQNIRASGGFFQNVLFYGPGGTGKSMISEFISKNSGMSYVKMSGGDLAQYIKRGEHVTELNKLMDKIGLGWRPWSSRPWILFIDEAESLCKDRDKIPKPELLELQNAFLNRTGTQSKKFMVILSTNRMEDLDEAILSRMDHKVYIGPPAEKERASIIDLYAPQFFSSKETEKFFNKQAVAKIANVTKGLTGRALFKLLNTVANKKAVTKDRKLTEEIIDTTVQEIILQEAEVVRRREEKEKRTK